MGDLNLLLCIFRVSKVALICIYIFIVRMWLPAGIFYLGHLPDGGEVVEWLASLTLTTAAHKTYWMGNVFMKATLLALCQDFTFAANMLAFPRGYGGSKDPRGRVALEGSGKLRNFSQVKAPWVLSWLPRWHREMDCIQLPASSTHTFPSPDSWVMSQVPSGF